MSGIPAEMPDCAAWFLPHFLKNPPYENRRTDAKTVAVTTGRVNAQCLRDPTICGFGGPDGALGRGGMLIVRIGPGGTTVVLVEVEEDNEAATVFVVSVVNGIGVARLGPSMA